MRNNIPLGSFHRSFEILPFKQKLKMSLGTLVIPFLSLFFGGKNDVRKISTT